MTDLGLIFMAIGCYVLFSLAILGISRSLP